jgi:hypothetical protein
MIQTRVTDHQNRRETMGADGAFDRRRKELALIAGKKEEEISEDEVVPVTLFPPCASPLTPFLPFLNHTKSWRCPTPCQRYWGISIPHPSSSDIHVPLRAHDSEPVPSRPHPTPSAPAGPPRSGGRCAPRLRPSSARRRAGGAVLPRRVRPGRRQGQLHAQVPSTCPLA